MESDEQSKALIKASFWPTSQSSKMQKIVQQKHRADETAMVLKPNYNINTYGKRVYVDDNINTNGKRVYVDDNFVYPPGYRFCPHDEELIVHYLRKKVMNEILPHDRIKEVNLYKHSPQELSEKYSMLGEKEWYFFTPRDRKYPNGDRPNRAAGTGYWKATGADRPIMHNNEKVGFRKALVFYQGKPPKGDKTNWIMHEFRVDESRRLKAHASDMRLDDWVLCRIYKKIEKLSPKGSRKEEQEREREQEDASKSTSPVGKVEVVNCDYEGNMYSCVRQQFELSLPQHMTDPNLYSLDNLSFYGSRLSDYEMNLQSSLLSDHNIVPMNFDFNLLDPYEIMGAIESHNVLNIGDLDENSSSDKED